MTLAGKWPELLTGLGIVGAGLIIGWEAATLRVGPLYAKVGPAAFMWLSSGLLVACGSVVAWRATGSTGEKADALGPAAIMAGLVFSTLLIEWLGFVPTCTVLFVLTGFGLGSRKLLRDAVIGLVLSGIAFLVFRYLLDLRLPAGALFQ